MRMIPGRSPIWFPLILLAALAALTLWIDRTVQPPQPKRDGSSRHDPDYRVENFTTTRSDASGAPRHVLSAIEMVHYPDDDSTHLVRPRFTMYSPHKPYTQIQGQRGQVSSHGEFIDFMDNVEVVRGATARKGELTVRTEYLRIVPGKDMAVTDRPVSIRQAPGTVARGRGMEYNKKLGTLKLFGGVRVHYEKPGQQAQPQQAVPLPRQTQQPVPERRQPAALKQKAQKNGKQSAQRTTPGKTGTGTTKTRIRRHYDQPATQP